MDSTALDKNDRAILRALQQDGRATITALALELNMSESACRRRIEKLERDKVITAYSCEIDPQKLGLTINVFVSISLNAQTDKDLTSFERTIKSQPEILECWLMTGQDDYLLRVVARDIEDLERIHREVLTKLPNVSRINTAIAMRAVSRGKSVHI
ncbi:MAG: AsnC family transcriptional regulator [Hyphomonadaceae bacterium]|nr:MAG: AsnC family transcriptional regulator [Hyphomonadaceae bacterium]KAF0187237.1 MAG: AsnC family transcriptional regulator [Hyphomonadaceae bacterium]